MGTEQEKSGPFQGPATIASCCMCHSQTFGATFRRQNDVLTLWQTLNTRMISSALHSIPKDLSYADSGDIIFPLKTPPRLDASSGRHRIRPPFGLRFRYLLDFVWEFPSPSEKPQSLKVSPIAHATRGWKCHGTAYFVCCSSRLLVKAQFDLLSQIV